MEPVLRKEAKIFMEDMNAKVGMDNMGRELMCRHGVLVLR